MSIGSTESGRYMTRLQVRLKQVNDEQCCSKWRFYLQGIIDQWSGDFQMKLEHCSNGIDVSVAVWIGPALWDVMVVVMSRG